MIQDLTKYLISFKIVDNLSECNFGKVLFNSAKTNK